MTSSQHPEMTPEEYLAFERASETRHEYVNGRVYAMTGASQAHMHITLNLGSELRGQLRGGPCATFVNDMRVKVSATGMYAYPDVLVACAQSRTEDGHDDTALEPRVIVEVLSPSTAHYDRTAKFAHYRRVESLREYVLVYQDEALVEHFARREDSWLLTTLDGLDDVLRLTSIECAIALRDIYERVAPFPVPSRMPRRVREPDPASVAPAEA